MAERYRNEIVARRQPLSEVKNRANTPPVQNRHLKNVKATSASPHNLPHNESLEANGSLAIRAGIPSSSEHKRVSQIANEDGRDPKRNSAISTTSTNASSRRRKTYIGHWQLGKTIGKGGCSRVRVVRHKTRLQYGAVKIITRTTAENTRAQSLANLIESTKGAFAHNPSGHKPIPYGLEREIAVMKLLEHPNIVQLYDVWENRNELYLIMEYVDGGELFHYVDQRKGLSEEETVYIFRQIVSALLYCHKLLICHRDLKPENILLNQNDLTVKLIDFGMAALQPEGRQLSTPCGSPHYAAPEVVSSRPYDGKQADVWSCGVILYVMLTGTTPYNYSPDGDIRLLFRDIAKANYWMPPGLSLEAKDLIKRIFVPDPKRRITMDVIWEHPLLHKYDKKLGLDGQTKEAAIGPIPTVTDFKLKRIQDVDREILRNMRTLWHSESEQSLVQKLLSEEINQEKLFYAALLKHREENLENYAGADDMDYSNSDYHHHQPPPPTTAPPLPSVLATRSQSQYSILNDEHLKPSHSFVEPPPSISSYDPYRASKQPIVNGRGEYVNVTVHRNGSSTNRRMSVNRSLRHPGSLRVEALKQGNRRVSNHSSSSLVRSSHSRTLMKRSPASKQSLSSSVYASSPPVIATMRPSDIHKRGVSFNHLRRTSTTSGLTSQDSVRSPPTPGAPDTFRNRRALRVTNGSLRSSSPVTLPEQAIVSKKERGQQMQTPRIKVRHPDSSTLHIRNDIRKHSAELEKACEEAFFRSSVGSSLTDQTTFSEKKDPFNTPPSSVSQAARGSVSSRLQDIELAARPLPDLPKDTPNTYLTKTLEETREKLAAYQSNGEDNTAKFDEVMKMLENIMPRVRTSPEKRAASAPHPNTIDHLAALPSISEEADRRRNGGDAGKWFRSATAPVARDKLSEDKTIRVVSPSPGTVAPLNVRKRSNRSDSSSVESPQSRLSPKVSQEGFSQRRANDNFSGLAVIDEDSTLPSSRAETPILKRKKSGWFGMNKKSADAGSKTDGTVTPGSLGDLDDRTQRRPLKVLTKAAPEKPLPHNPPPSAQSSEFPIRRKRLVAGKKGFTKWLGRMGGEKDEAGGFTGDSTMGDTSMDSLFSSSSPTPSSDDSPPSAGPERSWFARFFHIKPVTKIVCFSIPRGRARQELVLLLREWQRHGIRDLEYSRSNNYITARVDKQNALDIKPVSFRIDMFVVLEHGRRVGLSIARFSQVKGAASGFKRVLEVVDGVMRGRGWLVEDEEKWKALCEVVGG